MLRPRLALNWALIFAPIIGSSACQWPVGEPGTQEVAPVEVEETAISPTEHTERGAPPEALVSSGPPLAAGQIRSIESGVVHVGVRPGAEGRRAASEADLIEVTVPAFDIDRWPYPNDPGHPPLTTSSRVEAAQLCESRGRRLCDELEWERACKGDETREYPGGESFDIEGCTLDPLSCASPHSVLGLGVFGFEWTASDVSRHLGSDEYSAVVRGGPTGGPSFPHRCGSRGALSPVLTTEAVTFRCCSGPIPELTYPEEEERRTFRVLTDVDNVQLASILLELPELAAYADNFRLFTASDIDRALGRGDKTRDDVTWRLLDAGVLRWFPLRGELTWVFAGTGGGSSFVAVIHPLPDGSFSHGASFVLSGEQTSIALAWEYGSPREILWSSCWGCAGDGGSVMIREEDDRIVVAQR